MKTKLIFTTFLILCITSNITAQDPREEYYQIEILQPSHTDKPQINGFATKRIKENLNRGLTAIPSADGKGIYLSWRLLENDDKEISFNVYRVSSEKTKKINKKPIKKTCDFTDNKPLNGEVAYYICPIVKNKKTKKQKNLKK